MDTTIFAWADSDAGAMQADRLMTRQRAARLLAAWRRRARQPANTRPLIVRRVGLHAVRVEDPNYFPPVVARMSWRAA